MADICRLGSTESIINLLKTFKVIVVLADMLNGIYVVIFTLRLKVKFIFINNQSVEYFLNSVSLLKCQKNIPNSDVMNRKVYQPTAPQSSVCPVTSRGRMIWSCTEWTWRRSLFTGFIYSVGSDNRRAINK